MPEFVASSAAEGRRIAASARPVTTASLTADLGALGIETGDVVIVHSSLSRLGWMVGGAQAVVEALLAAVGSSGTVVMPAQSSHLSDPAEWQDPPVPADWVDEVRDHLPAFDPDLTPTRSMGAVVECFRAHRATRRSNHPTLSFVANGPAADAIVGSHPLTPGFGESSPLARLYELDAKVLLLGIDHSNCTSLHLAEERAVWPGKTSSPCGAPVRVDGRREWVVYDDLDHDADDFATIGEAFAAAGAERSGPVGDGVGRVSRQRELVDFAVAWMTAHR
jgi:aminoglycoside 3-N-acetyltransferase